MDLSRRQFILTTGAVAAGAVLPIDAGLAPTYGIEADRLFVEVEATMRDTDRRGWGSTRLVRFTADNAGGFSGPDFRFDVDQAFFCDHVAFRVMHSSSDLLDKLRGDVLLRHYVRRPLDMGDTLNFHAPRLTLEPA